MGISIVWIFVHLFSNVSVTIILLYKKENERKEPNLDKKFTRQKKIVKV